VLVAVAGILALQDQPGHGWRRVPPALRAVAPWLGVAALYAVLRLAVVDLADPPAAYRPRFGANLIRHFWMQPRYLAGGGSRLAVALLGLLAVVALCIRRARTGDADPLRRLLRAYTWLGPWLVLAIAVFATLPFSHSRFAMTLQVPGALLLGVHLDALWRLFADRRAALLRAVFVGVVALALPLGALRDRAAHPVGADARALVEGVARLHPHPPVGVPLLLIYGGDGLADRTRVDELRRRTYNGIAVRAVHAPELGPVRFVGVQEASRVDCPRCLRVGLTPDLRVIPYGSP
jgi:hypothetical protein